jgi:hypothetical protein
MSRVKAALNECLRLTMSALGEPDEDEAKRLADASGAAFVELVKARIHRHAAETGREEHVRNGPKLDDGTVRASVAAIACLDEQCHQFVQRLNEQRVGHWWWWIYSGGAACFPARRRILSPFA